MRIYLWSSGLGHNDITVECIELPKHTANDEEATGLAGLAALETRLEVEAVALESAHARIGAANTHVTLNAGINDEKQ